MPDEPPRRRGLQGLRVLVVEDEILIAMLIEGFLQEFGCVVAATAARPDQALRILEETAVDAAILDVNLDGSDSFGVAAALCARGLPFVFATGYRSTRLDPRFADRPVLAKPFQACDLEAALVHCLAPDRPTA